MDVEGNERYLNVIGCTYDTDRFGNMAKAYKLEGSNDRIWLNLDSNFSELRKVTISTWFKIPQ